jgi:hypothetical protein
MGFEWVGPTPARHRGTKPPRRLLRRFGQWLGLIV